MEKCSATETWKSALTVRFGAIQTTFFEDKAGLHVVSMTRFLIFLRRTRFRAWVLLAFYIFSVLRKSIANMIPSPHSILTEKAFETKR